MKSQKDFTPIRSTARSSAFTLMELLVVIAIISILAAMLMSTLSSAKQRALRTQCMSNMRQIGMSLHLYAEENHDLLLDCTTNNPNFHGAVWPWDMNMNAVNEIETHGAPHKLLYCPANQGMDTDKHWMFYNYMPGAEPIRVLGYAFLLNGCEQIPTTYWRKNILGDGTNSPSQTEWVIDAVAAMDGDFAQVVGYWTDRSSHISGHQAIGGNITYEDGHADWRNFNLMQHRFSTGGAGGDVDWYF